MLQLLLKPGPFHTVGWGRMLLVAKKDQFRLGLFPFVPRSRESALSFSSDYW